MRIAAFSLALLVAGACEPVDGTDDTSSVDTDTDGGETDCVVEDVEDPMNGPASGPMEVTTVQGGVCDGDFDDYVVNVSTSCTIQTQLTFDEERDDSDALVADGSMSLEYFAGGAIGTTDRVEDGTTVTLTNNPTDDSFGAVRIRVRHTAGEQLDYTFTVSTTCAL